MSKLANLLVMAELLKTGKKYSVKELSNYLEVSERMIREYKLFLEEAGIYVDTIRGPYGGYVLRQNISIPTPQFSDSDVQIIREIRNGMHDSNLEIILRNIEMKITNQILNEENKNNQLITDSKEQDVYNKLSKAMKYHYKVKINYHNLQHGDSIRTIYPLGMYLFQNEWWCSSYWEEKDDMRQFHIKRIHSCEILIDTFNPEEINLKF